MIPQLNWQGDVALDAGFNPLRRAPELAGGAACSCLASMDVTPVSRRPAAITSARPVRVKNWCHNGVPESAPQRQIPGQ
jgi:hypothetical protein